MRLDPGVVRTIDRTGGTFLHTSRTNPAKVQADGRARLPGGRVARTTARATTPRTSLRVLEHLGLDALIPIGGDDTLSFALRLPDEGVPGRRDPQDDGQRRPRHRLLHRLLDGRHPHRASSSTSCARAPGRTSGWRSSRCSGATAARRRSSPRTCPGSTARSSPRCRSTSRSSAGLLMGDKRGEPEQLRDDDDLRGRHADRRRDGPGGPRGRVRAPQARRHRSAHERAAEGAAPARASSTSRSAT